MGQAVGRRLRLDGELVLGRAVRGEGRLDGEPDVSRRHALIWRDAQDRFVIEDLG